jgi:catalase
MLQGRTFSYSDTQRYRVGTNYLQLPINAPKAKVATNQRDGQMTYHVDVAQGQNPHVNYEPSNMNGLKEAPKAGNDHTPLYNARLVRQKIDRTNDFKQAGERWRLHEDWEKDDLIKNLVNTMASAEQIVKDKMVELFTKCDPEYGRRVADGLKQVGPKEPGPIGSTETHTAVRQAEEMAKEAKPY